MRRQRVAIIILLVLTATGVSCGEDEDPYKSAKEYLTLRISPIDERGFARLDTPKKGEWLATHREPPQTLEILPYERFEQLGRNGFAAVAFLPGLPPQTALEYRLRPAETLYHFRNVLPRSQAYDRKRLAGQTH